MPLARSSASGQPLVLTGVLFMDNQEEIWKDVVGQEGRYAASNLGRIKSLSKRGRPELILKLFKRSTGYLGVSFMDVDRKWKSYMVHRVVLEAFVANPENKPQVNHKNGIRDDNRLVNLEWVTPAENTRHMLEVLDSFHPKRLLNDDAVKDVYLNAKEGSNKYKSKDVMIMAVKHGCSVDTIRRIIKRTAYKDVTENLTRSEELKVPSTINK